MRTNVFHDDARTRKARGAFFTPPEICQFLTSWGIRKPTDRILEPSCGDANFLISAASRLNECRPKQRLLFNSSAEETQLVGIDIHEYSVDTANERLKNTKLQTNVINADFFDLPATHEFDVVLGNPPFVRYQSVDGESRTKALRRALAAGVNLNGLSSSWAAFLIHACQFLKPDGRLGMVLPAELLAVNYAAPVRRYLLSRFARLRIVVFEKLVFPDALEDVVLLMAEGQGPCPAIEVIQVTDTEGLNTGETLQVPTDLLQDDRWTATLVTPKAWEEYNEFSQSEYCERLSDWGRTYLGIVTGENKFFCLSQSQANEHGLAQEDLIAISPPGSRHLRAIEFSKKSWQGLLNDDRKCWLFYPAKDQLTAAANKYISSSTAKSIKSNYKCRVRTPWWRVPLIEKADLFLTYMDHERPRLINNSSRSLHLNSLYGVSLKPGRKKLGCELLPIAALNTVSLLGAEVNGRSYGGGLLKLEPREADKIPMPSVKILTEAREQLLAIRPQISYALEHNNLGKAVSIVDQIIWGNKPSIVAKLETFWRTREFLFNRRNSRSKTRVDG